MLRISLISIGALILLSISVADAAKRKLPTDLETTEGAMLKHLMDEPDAAKKVSLMEDFAAKHPTHEATTWVLGELQTAYLGKSQFSKALQAGEKVLADDPDDVVMANGNLKAAEGIKDAKLVEKWATTAAATARRVIKSPKPEDSGEAAAWRQIVEYAKQVNTYCDYALYSLVTQTTDPAQRISVGEALLKQSPTSQYAPLLRPQLFVAYQQTGNHVRALQIAEEELQGNSSNDDMLIYAASKAYEKQDKAKVAAYAKRLIESLPAKGTPQGVSDADWTRNKNLKIGMSQWMLGVMASNEQRWLDADTHLRAALPLVNQNKDIAAETLFHLGLANYKLGDSKKDKTRILDALKFNGQCAAIPSSFQAQAKKNVAAIRSQYHIQ